MGEEQEKNLLGTAGGVSEVGEGGMKALAPSLTQVNALPPSKQWPARKALFPTHFIAEHGLE